MSDPVAVSAVAAAEEIRFDRVEPVEGGRAVASCSRCNEALPGTYYEVAAAMICPSCRDALEASLRLGTPIRRFLRAAAGGSAAAALGAGIYYAVRALTGYEFGLIAIVVGLMVGGAVRWGCFGRGGWFYQALAMMLTYAAIVGTYVPMVFEELSEYAEKQEAASASATPAAAAATADVASASAAPGPAGQATSSATAAEPGKVVAPAAPAASPAPQAAAAEPLGLGGFLLGAVFFVLFVAAVPFLAGMENVIGWFIIGFALYEAWKINRKRVVVISGPFQLAGGGVAVPASVPEAAPPPIE